MIWGAVPTDENWAKSTQIYKDALCKFEFNKEWQELYKKESDDNLENKNLKL